MNRTLDENASASVQNYFNYFTEIEEHFQRRRGTILLLTTLDWALIEVWKDAGIPLEAVLRGIDSAFDRFDKRPSSKKVNSLAFCAQEVLIAAEEMKEAAIGAGREQKPNAGFDTTEVLGFLRRNAETLRAANVPETGGVSIRPVVLDAANTLEKLAAEFSERGASPRLEDLERRLTIMEEKLFAVLLAATPDEQLVAVRAESDRELAPYRRKMQGAQIDQLQKQFLHKRLLEKYGLPRLSLFYM